MDVCVPVAFRIVPKHRKKRIGLFYGQITRTQLQIADLFVYPKFRNHKYGSRLLHDGLKWAQDKYKLESVALIDTSNPRDKFQKEDILLVDVSDPTNEKNFFNRFGFQTQIQGANLKIGNISQIVQNLRTYLDSKGFKRKRNGFYFL